MNQLTLGILGVGDIGKHRKSEISGKIFSKPFRVWNTFYVGSACMNGTPSPIFHDRQN